ncbi:fasciculation and elongation protein zeta-2 isoform X2 [Notothenia coriiceps]|uniref:Fasciculation and elongation protein zeta-2 isoform X2 n=1 Tax=Notothenia coriiceps TaxID=8208 RepID=A0A6I9PLS0_9TELE|nr:PREDICTED: fasciculation and elongation protein zeta-2-like isoform X2 [Notothenia coriiceps]
MAAPIAHFDEDWPILGDLSMVSDQRLQLPQKGRVESASAGGAAPRLLLPGDDDIPDLQDGSFSPGETGSFRSMEDLVNDFDDKLSVCFQNFNANTDSIAPVSVITEESLLEKDEIWKVLTSNYGHVMPVDWKQSRTCSLHKPSYNLEEKPRKTDVTVELSDDEELREQLDMHSIIVSSLADEPLFTAEQVIEEIEEMMQDSPDMEAGHNPSQSDLSMLSLDVQRCTRSPSYESRVRSLSVAELNERLEETETTIRMFSEELVLQLALRDELDFEKEVKNSFISALIDVQNRQKEHRELLKKRKKKLKAGAGTSQGHAEKNQGSYLTTVIPYEKKGHPPSLEDLEILTKILQAMRDDSDKVPSLLTDYILKVLCPT